MRLVATPDAKRPVAPCLHSTGVLGINRTTAVPVGNQPWSWLIVIPGHKVTTVGRSFGSNESRVGASCFATAGMSAGRVQRKRMCDFALLLVRPGLDILLSCQMRGSRLSSETRIRGYRDRSSCRCSSRRPVTTISQSRVQWFVEDRIPLIIAWAR